MTWLVVVLGVGAGLGLTLIAVGLGALLPRRRTPPPAPADPPVNASPEPVSSGGHEAAAAAALDQVGTDSQPAVTDFPVRAAKAPTGGTAAAPRIGPAPTQTRSLLARRPAGDNRRVWVRLLGPVQVEVDGHAVYEGVRGRPLELLCYFVLHPDGASPVTAARVLWPHVQPGREPEYFANALRRLRNGLRAATGDPRLMVIQHRGQHYRIDQTMIDADVWRLRAALTQARQAPDATTAVQALENGTAYYLGELADGAVAWMADLGQELRVAVVNALAWLAELYEQTGDLLAAVAALERALRLDPAAEGSAQVLMRLHARLGQVDGVRRTFRRLEVALADLGEVPAAETRRLRDELLNARRVEVAEVAGRTAGVAPSMSRHPGPPRSGRRR